MAASNMPAAEVEVDAHLVRSLLVEQHPDLAGLPLAAVAFGWDCTVFRLGDDLAVRLPRRAIAAGAFANEQAWLGTLAPALPLPVPVTLRIGAPSERFPFAWSVCPWLPGRTADVDPPADQAQAAGDLGRFLAALHRPAPPDAPTNPFRGVPLADRVERFAEHVAAIGHAVDVAALQARWATALAAPAHEGPPEWIHGDLHPSNLLVHHGRLSGVIDFVDLCGGDPATDLAAAWMLLDDPADRERFRRAAGARRAVDDATWARAEGWALVHAVATLANSADNPAMAAISGRTLARLGLP